MRQSEYERRITVPMVPHIWIAATAGPFLLFVGIHDFTKYEFYLSIFFLSITTYSITKGVSALKHGIYSDFIMLALIPFILPILLGIYFYIY